MAGESYLRRVVLLAGPSGCGKSTTVRSVGLPLVHLDDFYRPGSDPRLPRDARGHVDWDDPSSWDAPAALAVLDELCATGTASVPVYDLRSSSVVGQRRLDLAHGVVVAEGVFAHRLVTPLRERGLLTDALVMRRDRRSNLVRRAARDLRDRRKPPRALLRRGLHLFRTEDTLVAAAIAAGCRPLSAAGIRSALREAAR